VRLAKIRALRDERDPARRSSPAVGHGGIAVELDRPAAAFTRPVIAATVLVLPAPFAPTTPTSSPSATLNDTPRTAVMFP
jgi:hypothetical protein